MWVMVNVSCCHCCHCWRVRRCFVHQYMPQPSLLNLRNTTTITASGISSSKFLCIIVNEILCDIIIIFNCICICICIYDKSNSHQLHVIFNVNVNGTGLIAAWYTMCAWLRIDIVYILLIVIENNSKMN